MNAPLSFKVCQAHGGMPIPATEYLAGRYRCAACVERYRQGTPTHQHRRSLNKHSTVMSEPRTDVQYIRLHPLKCNPENYLFSMPLMLAYSWRTLPSFYP